MQRISTRQVSPPMVIGLLLALALTAAVALLLLFQPAPLRISSSPSATGVQSVAAETVRHQASERAGAVPTGVQSVAAETVSHLASERAEARR